MRTLGLDLIKTTIYINNLECSISNEVCRINYILNYQASRPTSKNEKCEYLDYSAICGFF